MPNRLLIVFLFLLCGHTAARTQNISKAIIGDTVFVGKYDIVEIGNSLWTNPCKGSEVDGVNWYGPYDDPKNIFIFILNKGIFSVYFHPKSTDTIKSCTYFEVLYKNYSRGCTGGSGRFDMCFSGYGIPTDSLVLIRPQQESFTLLPSAIQKRYSGILVVQVSNNTNSIVSLKSTSLFADSLSLITLDSVMDSTGKRLAVIPPFANRMKVLISLSSKRGPVLKDETYSSSINFLLSRLGIDSIYTNTPTLTLPRPNNLGLTSMQDSLVFHSTVGEKQTDTIIIKTHSNNVQFDSLSYPFKITSVAKTDTSYAVQITGGPAVAGTYTSNLSVHYTFDGYDGSAVTDAISVPLKAYIQPGVLNPSTISFTTNAFEKQTRSFGFHLPTYAQRDSVKALIASYPFTIGSISTTKDTAQVAIECNGTGGIYASIATVKFPVIYYSDSSHIQKYILPATATIDNSTDSIFWYPTTFTDSVSIIQTDSTGTIYIISDSLYTSSDGGSSWIRRHKLPGIGKELIVDTSGLYLLTTGNWLWKSIDTFATWYQLDGMKYYGKYAPPYCQGYAKTAPIDHIFLGRPFDNVLYAYAKFNNECMWAPDSLYNSKDNGEHWQLTEYFSVGHYVWGRDTAGHFISTYPWNTNTLGTIDVRSQIQVYKQQILMAAFGTGCYASNNNGTTWYGLNGGLTTKDITSLAFDGERFWAGTKSSGVFRSKPVRLRNSSVRTVSPKSISTIYPNPAIDKIKIPITGNKSSYMIFDITGKIVLKDEIEHSSELSVSTLPNGVYLLLIRSDSGQTTYPFIVSR